MPADAATAPAAEWRGVSKRFGTASVLEDFSLRAERGEFLTLLGPSGCGKTTALRLLGGLEQPDAGSVFLDGRDVTALPVHRREVNQVFQSYALFPHLSVRGNLAFGLRMKRLSAADIAAKVDAAAALVALDGLLDRAPAQLSGGQRQRVALARALVCEPKVLLLDEPLSALDARLRVQVRTELRALQRRLGLTFVFVTHDQEEALALSDRVAVLNAGRVEQVGTPEDIYARPASRFVAGFVGHANLLPASVVGRVGEGWTCRFHGQVDLLAHAAPGGLDLAPGQTVTLMIRPEHVRVHPSGTPALSSALRARVTERTFQGAASRLALSLDQGPSNPGAPPAQLLALLPGHAPGFPRGDEILLTFDPAAAVILP